MSAEQAQNQDPSATETTGNSAVASWLGRAARLLLVLVMLAAGAGVSVYWLTRRPKAQRQRPQTQARLVEVARVYPQSQTIIVRCMGTVVPARTIHLASQVAGKILEVSPEFVPGGHFVAGRKILQIDPKDYELAVQQRASNLAKTQCDLKVEMGQQSVARREYELLGKEVQEEDKELFLREPQLAMARAAVLAAQAALEQAELDLMRTEIAVLFNAMVQSRSVDLGSHVNVGTALASLVGTDKYWVQVTVPVDELKWISIPGRDGKKGSPVRVYYESAWGPNAFRSGAVERLMTDLETEGRMARILVAVEDPVELKSGLKTRQPLILGSYVRVEIEGRDIHGVVRVPRTALRDGTRVWVIKSDRTLDIRPVTIAWSGNEHVYVQDVLDDGDLLITSDLAAPVQGMALRTAEPSTPPAAVPQSGQAIPGLRVHEQGKGRE